MAQTESFYALTLENYPGENIAEFATEAVRLNKSCKVDMLCPLILGLDF
jgi:hypothetical protein